MPAASTPALDIEQPAQLVAYLRAAGHIGPTDVPEVRVLAGGVSNRTVLVEIPGVNSRAWVLKQALAKLRVKVDWFSDPVRIHREALGLRWLEKLAPPGTITPLVFEDATHHLLAMQAVPPPHDNWKTLLLAGQLHDEHIRQFATLLGTIHRSAHAHQAELSQAFADWSFFESLRLEPYYLYTASQVAPAAEFLHTLVRDTRARRLTIVHGDYSPKNILVHQERLILLDHEVIHFGDPGFDLGFALTHLLSKAHHLPHLRGCFARCAMLFWSVYETLVRSLPIADNLEAFAVRHTLACLLARVRGRSPLEYLAENARARQAAVVTTLMQRVPHSVPALIDQFVKALDS